jgi:predicted nucleic acid-binding protein
MAVTHLLDTSVYSQPLKRKPVLAALKRWEDLGDARVAASIVSEAEVLFGLAWSGASWLQEKYDAELKSRLPLLIVDRDVATHYATIRAALRRQGMTVENMDLLIAATAKAHGLILATLNVKDFENIDGLTIEDWSEPLT